MRDDLGETVNHFALLPLRKPRPYQLTIPFRA